MSIFKKAAEKGKVSSRTPFLDMRGIFRVKVNAVRQGELLSTSKPFVAIDFEVKQAVLADKDKAVVPGTSYSLMASAPENRTYEDMFFNTLVSWAHQLMRHFAVLDGQAPESVTAEDITAEALEALFGANSMLVGNEIQFEAIPKISKKGNTVWNYVFQTFDPAKPLN
jgi:hypothetical protein